MKSRKFFSVIAALVLALCLSSAAPAINGLALINRIYKIMCDMKPADTQIKYAALTFDDGPHPEYTSKILDILAEKGAPATFFVVGYRADLHPAALRRMRDAGCEIGNHTYDHVDVSAACCDEFLKQIEKCSAAVYQATGEYPRVYRPPFGRICAANEQALDGRMRKILWNVDSADWTTPDKNKIIKKVISSVSDGAIILMHDFYSQTVEALPEIIDRLRAQGYELVTVSGLP